MSNLITILYVDDEPLNVMVFEENFNTEFTVITAGSGYEALELLNSMPEIKIVISDMKMPGMDGLEFITKAKSEFANISYFILTGYSITSDIADALKNKLIIKYFSKPFNIEEIENAIKNAIK